MTRRRPWFQYHLSTAIVLPIIAGELLWANMSPRACIVSLPEVGAGAEGASTYYGWPWPVVVSCYSTEQELMAGYLEAPRLRNSASRSGKELDIPYFSVYGGVDISGLLLNVLVAVLILAATAVGLEILTRRRKPAAPGP